jgi:hypothetical protein
VTGSLDYNFPCLPFQLAFSLLPEKEGQSVFFFFSPKDERSGMLQQAVTRQMSVS